MRIAWLEKEGFVDWVGSGRVQHTERTTAKLIKSPPRSQILLVWQDGEETEQNPIVVIPRNEMRDFFAFVSTYVPNYRPFSAFFRVLPFETLSVALERNKITGVHTEQFSKLIGVSLSEAFIQSAGKLKSLDSLSIQGVQATLSAALMSAVWKGFAPNDLEVVADRWFATRKLVGSGGLAISPSAVLEVWQELASSLPANKRNRRKKTKLQVSNILREAFDSGKLLNDWFAPIVREVLGSEEAVTILKSAREERIRNLPVVLNAIEKSNADRSVLEFVAGGLLSMVGNGSVSQLQLTTQLAPQLPKASLWFGVVSSFQSQNDALTASNCLGRRAVREILRPVDLFSPPTHDVALEELDVLGDAALENGVLRTDHSVTISIGLLDHVQASFRRTSKRRDEEAQIQNERRLQHDLELMDELRFMLERANHLVHEITRPAQLDLFSKRSSSSKISR